MRQHKSTWTWTDTLCSLIHCIIGETQNAVHSERISCLDMLYLKHWGTSLGPGTLACTFFTHPYYQPFTGGSPRWPSLSSFLSPGSHFIITHLHCVGPTLLHLNNLSETCIHLLAQPQAAMTTQLLGHVCSWNTSTLLEKKCRKSLNSTGHYKWKSKWRYFTVTVTIFVSVFP